MTTATLFSGIEGMGLGLEIAGVGKVVWQAETDRHASAVLARHYPGVPNHGDVSLIDYSTVEPVDVVCAGFPCQPVSSAGLQKGIDDERWLWPEVVRCLGAVRPRWFVGENVSSLRSIDSGRVFANILADLADLGYVGRWQCIRASDVGAAHRRERVFLLATLADDFGCERSGSARRRGPRPEDSRASAAHADEPGLEGGKPAGGRVMPAWGDYGPAIRRWEAVLGRAAPDPVDDGGRLSGEFTCWLMGFPEGWVDGIPRSAQLRCLGNACVPHVAAVVGGWIVDAEERKARFSFIKKYLESRDGPGFPRAGYRP